MGDFGEQFLVFVKPSEDPWDSHQNPTDWKDSTIQMLKKIAAARSGMALLKAIQNGGKRIVIEPLNWQECNAHGGPAAMVLNGKFFDGIVKFEPAVFMKPNACFTSKHLDNPDHNRGALPDEVLFRELIHAHRHAIGAANGSSLGGGLYRYQNDEEFLAVVMTNIYISDETNPHHSGLRRDHTGHDSLETNLSSSLAFYKSSPQVLPLIRKFADDAKEKFLFRELAKVNSKFNPFAALVECERAVKAQSTSSFAMQRETVGYVAEFAGEANSFARGVLAATGIRNLVSPKPLAPDFAAVARETLAPLALEALRVLRR